MNCYNCSTCDKVLRLPEGDKCSLHSVCPKEVIKLLQVAGEVAKAITEVTFVNRGDALRMAALVEKIEELIGENNKSNQQGG